MSELVNFRYVVKYLEVFDKKRLELSAKFTNEKHARLFIKKQKVEGIKAIKLYLIDEAGKFIELKVR